MDKNSAKEALTRVVDELPPERVAEVLDFARFLKGQTGQQEKRLQVDVRALPAATLKALVGYVAWGGDALADTEALYE